MKKIGVFYGSTLGYTKTVAELIKRALGDDNADIFNIDTARTSDVSNYDRLIFGTSTWGVGEMQEDWEKFAQMLESVDLTSKKLALFGTGDQKQWPDSFVNGLGALYHRFKDRCEMVGFTSTQEYNFDISLATRDGRFVGLAIDNVNQPDLTSTRIAHWVKQLQAEFN